MPRLSQKIRFGKSWSFVVAGRNKRPHLAGYPTRARRCMHCLPQSLSRFGLQGPRSAESSQGPQLQNAAQFSGLLRRKRAALPSLRRLTLSRTRKLQNQNAHKTRAGFRGHVLITDGRTEKGTKSTLCAHVSDKAAILFRIGPPQNTFGCTLNRTKYQRKGS